MLRVAPLLDHNMACLPMMMKTDNFSEYINAIGPKIGSNFVTIARAMFTSSTRAKLIALKDFEYRDPGFDYPKWKLDAANKLKDVQIKAILA